jgi:hypothetical protein
MIFYAVAGTNGDLPVLGPWLFCPGELSASKRASTQYRLGLFCID